MEAEVGMMWPPAQEPLDPQGAGMQEDPPFSLRGDAALGPSMSDFWLQAVRG